MFYQIHRYPADLIDVLHLSGDQRVVIRPVLPQDEAVTGAFFHDAARGVALRPLPGSMRTLPPSLLAHLTHVDYSDHLALVAEVFADDRETVIAEARYARGPDKTAASSPSRSPMRGRARGLPAFCSVSSPAAPSPPASRDSAERPWPATSAC